MFSRLSFAAILLSLSSTGIYAAQDRGAICDGCSSIQNRDLAVTTAGSAASFGVTVFIVDFRDDQLNKYFVMSGTPKRPELQKFYEELPPNISALSEQQVETRNGSVTVVETQLTSEEEAVFADVVIHVNYFESQGSDVVNRSSNRGGSNPTANGAFDVPAGMGFDSAFDAIDFPAITRQIGSLAREANFRIGALGRLGSSLNNVIPAIDTFVNLDTQYEFIFSDGSVALWAFDNFNRLDAVPGTFRDSDGNNIPSDADDADRGFFFGGPGLPNGNDNMNSMMDRLGGFGFGFDFSGVGSGGASSCRFLCDEVDDHPSGSPQVCFVTCSP